MNDSIHSLNGLTQLKLCFSLQHYGGGGTADKKRIEYWRWIGQYFNVPLETLDEIAIYHQDTNESSRTEMLLRKLPECITIQELKNCLLLVPGLELGNRNRAIKAIELNGNLSYTGLYGDGPENLPRLPIRRGCDLTLTGQERKKPRKTKTKKKRRKKKKVVIPLQTSH